MSKMTPTKRLIISALSSATTPMTYRQLISATGSSIDTIKDYVRQLGQDGLITRSYRPGYETMIALTSAEHHRTNFREFVRAVTRKNVEKRRETLLAESPNAVDELGDATEIEQILAWRLVDAIWRIQHDDARTVSDFALTHDLDVQDVREGDRLIRVLSDAEGRYPMSYLVGDEDSTVAPWWTVQR